MSTGHDYLDGVAAKLTGTYTDCSDDIAGLLEKYKKTLTVAFPHIGDTSEEMIASFENDVHKHWIRNKTDRVS
jgi:hypothetical protein